jgi:hypothetical protein
LNYLLYSPESSVTGKQLLDWLRDNGASDLKGGTDPGNQQVHKLIRWGSRKQLLKKATGDVLNKLPAMNKAVQKGLALNLLDQGGVPIPRTWSKDAPLSAFPFPCLGRKEHHSHGSDIVLCLQQSDIPRAVTTGCNHFTEYIPCRSERRLHVFRGNVIKISEKQLEDPAKYVPWMRNTDSGHVFKAPAPGDKTPMAAKLAAVEATDTLGLDFAAVDIIIGDTPGMVAVLELNTSPSLIEDGVERYGKRFLEFLTTG